MLLVFMAKHTNNINYYTRILAHRVMMPVIIVIQKMADVAIVIIIDTFTYILQVM